jgi:hypothetical protein
VPQKGANTQWAASMHKTARWPAPAACNLGSRLFFTGVLGVHVGLGREHADLHRTGAISLFIWWHNEGWRGSEEIWPDHQKCRGRIGQARCQFRVGPSSRFKALPLRGQGECAHNPINNRLRSRRPHQAASVGLRAHGDGTLIVHPGETRHCAFAIARPAVVTACAAVCKKSPSPAHAHT